MLNLQPQQWLDADVLLGTCIYLLLSTTTYPCLDAPQISKFWERMEITVLSLFPPSLHIKKMHWLASVKENPTKCLHFSGVFQGTWLPPWEIEMPKEMIRGCKDFRGKEAHEIWYNHYLIFFETRIHWGLCPQRLQCSPPGAPVTNSKCNRSARMEWRCPEPSEGVNDMVVWKNMYG